MTAAPERLLSVAPSPAFWVAIVAYTVASAMLLVVLGGQTRFRSVAIALVATALVAHGVDIGWRGTQHVHPAQSVREAIGFLAFIITAGYLLASTRYRLTLGGVVVMPVSLVLLLAARLTPAGEATDLSTLGRIHISLATVGVGVFALASALSAIYLAEERALKRKKFDGLAFKDKGAPLDALDRLSHRLIWIGFPIFTVALVLGAIWVFKLGESLDRLEYPLAGITWISFAILLVARAVYGWRGKKAAKLTLLGFSAALAVLAIYLVRRMVG
ncbi:MAG: cytochrome c biogenesis protein CcsA [Deltaproteobacteria bacterium]|nr:cytochrome c biogenesis protein CcsA [Deltaproteobacteria bacterium]